MDLKFLLAQIKISLFPFYLGKLKEKYFNNFRLLTSAVAVPHSRDNSLKIKL